MDKPQMILFDYGGTLMEEPYFKRELGIAALMPHVISNPRGATVDDIVSVQSKARAEMWNDENSAEIYYRIEICHQSLMRYVLEYCGIELDIDVQRAEEIYWDATAPAYPTDGIESFLDYLYASGIRTGVISNLTYSGVTLKKRINSKLPNHHFEFVLATCDYLFKKPYYKIFELAARNANLPPENCWYAGDTPHFDVCGAIGIGMTPILYTGVRDKSHGTYPHTGIIVHSWAELRKIFDTLS